MGAIKSVGPWTLGLAGTEGERQEPVDTRRGRRTVENDDFASFARRIISAHGRRIAAGDVEGLRDLLALDDAIQTATTTAVGGLRRAGFSWGEIALRLGVSRQAAQQRWGATS